MRKAMEKLMGVKKDGGQEVLITLGLVAIGVVLLVAFSTTGNEIVSSILADARTRVTGLFSKSAIPTP